MLKYCCLVRMVIIESGGEWRPAPIGDVDKKSLETGDISKPRRSRGVLQVSVVVNALLPNHI